MAFLEFLASHIDKLNIEGDLATGQIDTDEKFQEFRDALRNFGFHFTTRSSRKENYGVDVKLEGVDGVKKRKIPGRGSLMYKSSSDVSVPFFGYPFIVETTIYYTCSQGIKYYGSKKYPDEMFREGDPLSKKRRRAKVTQKIGCQARMTVKKIKVFSSQDYYASKDNWREKKAAIDVLKSDLEGKNKIECYIRFCIVLSLDSVHNHKPLVKIIRRPKRPAVDPAKKVLKLQENIQDALLHLNSDLLSKCTNITTLTNCCNSLKQIINQFKDSIERADGIPAELIAVAMEKMQKPSTPQLECCTNAAKRAAREKAKEADVKVEVESIEVDCSTSAFEAAEESAVAENNNQIIEIPGVLDGTQVIWDPVNVSWMTEAQGLVIQQEEGATPSRTKPSILVQRRVDETSNIGVVQGGQNYAIVQHGSIPNVGMSVPITMAKVLPHGSLLTTGIKKAVKRNDVGVTIAIPANVEWNHQNWVVSGDQFSNVPTQAVWNIA